MRGSRAFSGTFCAALALALLSGAAAQAKPPADNGAIIGVGMICDSQAQAARFVELRAKGRKADAAMAAVNKESHNPRACGLAVIAFKQDATLDSRSVDNKLVQVVRITIMAGYTGGGWKPVKGYVQYAVVEGEGIEV